jgi:hypothetical protein
VQGRQHRARHPERSSAVATIGSVEEMDDLQVSRPPGIRDSNWELRPLTKRQYNYAHGCATAQEQRRRKVE